MVSPLALFLCLGAGLVGGVFFAFSTFVMKALEELPPSQGVHAMQRINIVVLNPAFLGAFTGSALLSVIAIAAGFFAWESPRSAWLVAAGLAYLAGTFLVTIRMNVPLNNRLANLLPESTAAATFWPQYVREWTRWNHVRTLAAIVSAACAACAFAS
jgi:uncharacterized membrane protein